MKKNVKERLSTGWNFQRLLFLIIGTVVIIQALMIGQWVGLLLGGYFVSMGLLGYGCASGACYGGSCNTHPSAQSNQEVLEKSTFEEIR